MIKASIALALVGLGVLAGSLSGGLEIPFYLPLSTLALAGIVYAGHQIPKFLRIFLVMLAATHVVLVLLVVGVIAGEFAAGKSTREVMATAAAPKFPPVDLLMWLAKKGVEKLNPMNTGGTTDLGSFSVSMVRADHSSGSNEGDTSVYLGNPHGLIVKAHGEPTVWHLGDTDIFSDMALISEIHQPRVALVPIGDRFTMGAKTAAMAVKRFLNVEVAIPCHFGTFPIIDPNAEIAEGYQPNVMPGDYEERLSDAELDALVQFLLDSVNS